MTVECKLLSFLKLDFNFKKLSNNNSVIEAKGIVVWTNSFKISTEDKTNYELGIEFTKISCGFFHFKGASSDSSWGLT